VSPGARAFLAGLAASNYLALHLLKGLIRLLRAVKAALGCGQDLDALQLRFPLPEGRRPG
jgi:hypothetical protein